MKASRVPGAVSCRTCRAWPSHALTAVESQERVLAELAALRRVSAQRNRLLLGAVSLLAAVVLMLGWDFLGLRLPRL